MIIGLINKNRNSLSILGKAKQQNTFVGTAVNVLR